MSHIQTADILTTIREEKILRSWFYGQSQQEQKRVLRKTAEQLRQEARPTVFLDPHGGEDSAHVVLVDTLAQLKEQGCFVPEFDGILNPSVPWEQKVHSFVSGLASVDKGTVFLLSSPAAWGTEADEDFYWDAKTRQVTAGILQHAPTVVYTGECMSNVPVSVKRPLPAPSRSAVTFLCEEFAGSVLENAARHLTASGLPLTGLNSVHLRLLVAYSFVNGDSASPPSSLYRLRQAFQEALNNRQWSSLRDAWYTYSLVRRPFTWDALREILREKLHPDEEAILNQCLMHVYPDDRRELAVLPELWGGGDDRLLGA